MKNLVDSSSTVTKGCRRVASFKKVQIISKKTPDVKEVTVFKRYSDFKKLHGELSYIHRNLFRKLEEFPVFPKAQVFGRFDQDVIEERRRCAEAMLQFTVNIPALYNSPQLKDFFKDGETRWPLELATPKDIAVLPEPLIPLPMAALARKGSRRGSDTIAEVRAEDSACASLNTLMCPAQGTPDELDAILTSEEEACIRFHPAGEADDEERDLQSRSSLPASDLALFDPCAKEDTMPEATRQSNLEALIIPGSQEEEWSATKDLEGRLATLRVWRDTEAPPVDGGPDPADYLSAAAQYIKEALEQEACRQYNPAFCCYLDGVDVLLRGLQGELSTEKQEAIKKRTAEYVKRAESIFTLHLKDMWKKDAPPPSSHNCGFDSGTSLVLMQLQTPKVIRSLEASPALSYLHP
ncbi:sorting nexin-15 isoform X2 [Narcine bancroftii]|uniref:sorting nexin-15 isoform X2 n=1 Tax=Narcine bancroftii TaxID=1343680 RepID=UPI003831FE91